MEERQLSYFKLEREGETIELRRGMDIDQISKALSKLSVAGPAQGMQAPAPAAPAPEPAAADAAALAAEALATAAAAQTINSPMVGTFYAASGPGEDAFVKVGDSVDPETTVCIIEAMKVMNEIKAEARGTIKRLLVDDASPVQYGEPLFEIEP